MESFLFLFSSSPSPVAFRHWAVCPFLYMSVSYAIFLNVFNSVPLSFAISPIYFSQSFLNLTRLLLPQGQDTNTSSVKEFHMITSSGIYIDTEFKITFHLAHFLRRTKCLKFYQKQDRPR